MIQVALIGKGNVSHHLQKAFSKTSQVEVVQVVPSRKINHETSFKDSIDIFIIAIRDDAIHAVSQYFKDSKKLILHTSGSISIDALPSRIRRGVFYPLQTFTKEREIDFETVPICVEAEHDKDLELLKELAGSISGSVHEISSGQREKLHLAAVFVNNFTNHMYRIGQEICQKNELDFTMFQPLMLETAKKLETLSPFEAQTGPAKRNDDSTIARQLEQLKVEKHKEIYQLLTESIKTTYGKEL